mgnify:CR=1 FL=1
MIERKHIEAIKEAWAVVDARVDWDNMPIGQTAAALDDAIAAALAALDESPCVWMEDGGRVIKTTCGHYWQPLDDGDRVDFPYCPFCRRKIADAPLPAAPEVKP